MKLRAGTTRSVEAWFSTALIFAFAIPGCAPRTPAESPSGTQLEPAPPVAEAAKPGSEHPLKPGYYPVAFNFAQAQPGAAPAAGGKPPNIVVIWGDDIGQSNVSAYS